MVDRSNGLYMKEPMIRFPENTMEAGVKAHSFTGVTVADLYKGAPIHQHGDTLVQQFRPPHDFYDDVSATPIGPAPIPC